LETKMKIEVKEELKKLLIHLYNLGYHSGHHDEAQKLDA